MIFFDLLFTLPFLLTFLFVSIVIILSMEFESYFVLIITTLLAIVGGWWFELYTIDFSDPFRVIILALMYFGSYFILGTGWAIAKWYFHVNAARRWLNEKLETGLYAELDPKYFGAKVSGTKIDKGKSIKDYAPKVYDFKGKITSWIMLWPWSMLWTIINDPVRRLVKWIYNSIKGMLQRMSDKAFE